LASSHWVLTTLLQCFDTVGWVIRPVELRLRNGLNCVKWDVTSCSINQWLLQSTAMLCCELKLCIPCITKVWQRGICVFMCVAGRDWELASWTSETWSAGWAQTGSPERPATCQGQTLGNILSHINSYCCSGTTRCQLQFIPLMLTVAIQI